ncbi:hypothetical protein Tco_1242219 [Tanacetum coccineum]
MFLAVSSIRSTQFSMIFQASLSVGLGDSRITSCGDVVVRGCVIIGTASCDGGNECGGGMVHLPSQISPSHRRQRETGVRVFMAIFDQGSLSDDLCVGVGLKDSCVTIGCSGVTRVIDGVIVGLGYTNVGNEC